ncbi:MAG: hypothetical protein ACI9AT_001033 [Ulvibacter sp.]|jgi:hypothetical protein
MKIGTYRFTQILAVIDRSIGIQVRELTTPNELKHAYNLRFNVYSNAGHIDQSEFQAPMLSDVWDEYSTVLGAFSASGELVGTVRLTTFDPFSFPSDNIFITKYPFDISKAIEIGKFAISMNGLLKNRLISFSLTLKAALISQEMGYEHWVFSTTKKLKCSFEQLGSKIYDLSSQLRPISDIKDICSNWQMFEKMPEEYFYLKLNELKPNIKKQLTYARAG